MKDIYVALENLRSLYNIGAIFRTCSFFGVNKVILVGYSGKKPLPNGKVVLHDEVSKSSLGSEKDLEITFLRNPEELAKFATDNSLKLVSVEQSSSSVPLSGFSEDSDVILVFGNEVDGVSSAVLNKSNYIVEIPKKGTHNSLNVTTTCGIVLYHLSSREH